MSLKQKGVYAMGEARAVTSDYHIVQLHVLFPALLAAPGCSAAKTMKMMGIISSFPPSVIISDRSLGGADNDY